jgi:hypothetical protein
MSSLRYLRFPWRAVAFGEGGFCFDSERFEQKVTKGAKFQKRAGKYDRE